MKNETRMLERKTKQDRIVYKTRQDKIYFESARHITYNISSNELLNRLFNNIQSTLVDSKSKGPSEILPDIRTLTYQMCRTEENTNFTNKHVI